MNKRMLWVVSVILFSIILAVPALSMVVTGKGQTFKYLRDRSTKRILYGQFLTTGNGRYAYCLHNNKHSPHGEDLPEGRILTDEVYTALTVGYPYRSYTGSKNKDYYATQAAIRCLTGEFNIDNLEHNPGWSKDGVIEAVRSIYNQAKNQMQRQESYIHFNQTNVGAELSGEYYYTPLLNTNSNNLKDGNLQLELSGAPAGTFMVNEWGGRINTVSIGQPFKIAIPKAYNSGDFSFTLSGDFTRSIAQVYSATKADMQDVVSLQDKRFWQTSDRVYVKWNNSGSLQIAKRDAETNALVGYAKFRVQGPNYDRYIDIPPQGYFDIWSLLPGTYTITEVAPPGGYLLGNNPTQTVQVKRGQMTYTGFTNYKSQGVIKLIKRDADTGRPLPGATYRFSANNGSHWDYTTDNTGVIEVPNWWFDTYKYKEIKAPPGYILDSTERSITISERKTYVLETTNKKAAGSIQVTKLGEGNKKLKGAHFDVKDSNGKVVKTIVTDNNGIANTGGLPYGTYTITETKAPTGYVSLKKDTTVTISENKRYDISVLNGVVHAEIKLRKIDTETKTGLEGATIAIKKDGNLIGKYTSGRGGIITIPNLEYGNYTAEEIKAPEGYVLNSSPVTFKVETNGQRINLDIPNTKKRGNITIIKKDDENHPVEGAEFTIKDSDGKVIHTVKTDKVGVANGGNLPWGTYTVEETKAPYGYIKSNESKTARIWFGIPQTVEFTNTRIKANLEIVKQDASTAEKLAGAQFKITGPNGYSNTVTTGNGGKVTINHLYAGEYTVVETKAPDGYNLNNTVRKFTVSENNKLYNLVFTNIKHSENITINKKDQNGNVVSGAKFEVRRKSDNSLVRTVTTDSKGKALIADLHFGSYSVQEVSAPEGYILDSKKQDLVVGMNPVSDLSFTNTRIHGNIKLIKKDDETGQLLKDAKYQITGPNSYYKEISTDDKGEINLTNLVYGEYTIIEMDAPKDYIIDKTPYKVKIDTHGKTYTVNRTNHLKDSNLNIVKIDDTGKNLSGVKFQLVKKSDNSVVKEGSTDGSGVLNMTGLRRGEYILKEVEIPVGHLNNTPNIPINIKGYENINKTIVNTRIKGTIKITKIDEETKKPLKDVKFRISKDGKTVKEVTTDINGIAMIPDLLYGKYTVQEIAVPSDYLLNKDVQEVNLTEDGKVYTVNYANRMKDCSITVVKTNEVGTRLSGVKFQLIDKTTNKVLNEQTTDNDGTLKFTGVRRGFYIVKETTVPTGHIIGSTTTDVTIDRREDITKTIENTRIRGKIKVTKLDEETKEPLANAQFNLIRDGKNIETITTDAKGEAVSSNILYGKYTVKEVTAPTNYHLNETPQEVNLTENGKTYPLTFENRMKDCSITVNKVNEIGEKLNGVQFSLLEKKSGKVITTETTDKDGKLVFNGLRRGNYIVREVSPPEGHIQSKTDYDVSITKFESPSITVINTRIRGDLKIVKLDEETKQPLSGANFKVLQGNTTIKDVTTDDNGEATVNKLLYGNYAIQEIEPPTNYNINSELKSFKVSEDGKLYTITFTNRMKDCSITINKVNEIGEKLSDAEFDLIDKSNNKVIKHGITDSKGKLIFDGLRRGEYTVKETKIPIGHVNSNTTRDISIKTYENPSVTIENTRTRGNIKVTKTDAEDGKLLPNTTFELSQNGNLLDTAKTNSKGEILFSNLLYGKYEIRETKSPEGYLKDNNVYRVNLTENGKTYPVNVKDERIKGDIEVYKVDKETKKPVPNTEFSVFKSGVKVHTMRTNNIGRAKTPKLDYGNYVVMETKPAEGYNLGNNVFSISIDKPNVTVPQNVANNVIKGSVKIIKTDEVNNSRLSGINFAIYSSDNKDVPVKTATTDDKGEILFDNLRYGDYIVKELRTKPEYYLNDKEYPVSVTEQDKVYTLNITNKPLLANIKLTKTDDLTNKALEGATFEVRKNGKAISQTETLKDGVAKPITEFKTDKDGILTLIEPLRYGDYEIVETKAPQGYNPIEPIKFTIDMNQKYVDVNGVKTLELKAVDKAIRGSVTLTKRDEEDKKRLQGVTFDLVRTKGLEEPKTVGTYVTDKNGEIQVDNLTYGDYYFKETKTLDNYVIDKTELPFSIVEEGVNIDVSKTNLKLRGNIEVTKVDSRDSKPLEGVEFSLLKDDKVVSTANSDKDGKLIFKDLLYGKYEVQETKALEGYVSNDEKLPFMISENGKTYDIKVTNKPIEGDFEISKTDVATGDLLPNAKFEILSKDMKQVLVKGTTNEKGVAKFKLDYGKYYYREYEAPNKYMVDTTPHFFQIEKDGDVVKATMTNKMKEGSVKVIKTDEETKRPLTGVKFALYDDKDKMISKAETDENGKLEFKHVKCGKYYVQEFETVEGYILDKSKHQVEITDNEQVETLNITNTPILGSIIINKVDSESKRALSDAYFEIRNSSDEIVDKGITNSEGVLEFNNLRYGDYYIKETQAPNGYKLNEKEFHVSIKENNSKIKQEVANEPLPKIVKTGVVDKKYLYAVPVVGLSSGLVFYRFRRR